MSRVSKSQTEHYLSILNARRKESGKRPIVLNHRYEYYALETIGDGTGVEDSRTGLTLREAYECIQAMITFC